MIQQDKLVKINELIDLLALTSKQAVYNKRNRGQLPIPTYKVGRSLYWKLSEVSDFINNLKSKD